jgi:uncharacterized membrane protein
MTRKGLRSWLKRKQKPVSLRRWPRWAQLLIEPLEERVMPDASLPPAIVVGRQLSSYFTGGIQNNQETITYTVYNEQASDVTGVLLTDTLEPGVTFQSASQPPDQSGQNLAWSLGTIAGFDRATVTLTVALGAGLAASPQLDTGAEAFATLNAGAVSNSTPAATVRQGSVDATLLASTPDANTTDPFIQEEAAKLNYDPQQIFNFLHQDIGYNSYTGSLRGARGTLWSSAGNALDVASLGVALMRASGIPAQYVSGTLSPSQSQQLILSMFPANYQAVGYIPSGTPTGDPANDPKLLAETESHYWFQFDAGSGFQDADPLMAGAQIGQTFTASTGTFTEVADTLRHKVEVQLNAELTSQAGALFGLGGQQLTTVLDQTFNSVDLVGRPLTIGHFISTASNPFGTTITYSPYIDVGDDAFPTTQDQPTRGQDYQEVLSGFAGGLNNQVLTGLFLDINLSGPDGPPESFQRTIVDRIGYAARQGLQQTQISADPNGPPALTNYDVMTLNMWAGANANEPLTKLNEQLQQEAMQLPALQSSVDSTVASEATLRNLDIGLSRLIGNEYLGESDAHAKQTALAASVTAYFDRPRVVMSSVRVVSNSTSQTPGFTASIDLIRDSMRIIAPPGQSGMGASMFDVVHGIFDNVTERNVVASLSSGGQTVQVNNTVDIFAAAAAQGIGTTLVTSSTLSLLDSLSISAEAKARITADISQGMEVLVPNQMVTLNGTATIGWAEINQATGEFIGVTQDGGHQGLFEFLTTGASSFNSQYTLAKDLGGPLAGFFVGAVLGVKYELFNLITQNPRLAAIALQADKAAAQAYVDKLAANDFLGRMLTGLSYVNTIYTITQDKVPSEASIGSLLKNLAYNFQIGFQKTLDYTVKALTGQDPPFNLFLSNLQPPALLPPYLATSSVNSAATASGGAVAGTDQLSSLAVSGALSASWATNGISSFQVTSLSVANGSVRDSGGKLVGSGQVTITPSALVEASVVGNNQFSVNGTGSLSFYGPAENSLGVSGNWDNYSASVTGNVSITLTTDGLTVNGQTQPAGTYTITTSAAMLSGSGGSTSPDFSGSASISATGGTISLGRGSGNVTVGGKAVPPGDGSSLLGYGGTITVAANGTGTDSATFNGTAANLLSVSGSPAMVTTDQNTPVTFQAKVQTSFADLYNLTVQAPTGWTVAIDGNGNVTATPAPGLQGGVYPIRIVAQSTTNAALVAQNMVNVTVNSTQPGLILAVKADPMFTVPLKSALLPTAFQAVIHNNGPTADTYNLTFANVPSGFSILSSASSVTIPAGQTGIVGVYLQPNTGQPIPAPGTMVSFMVTATSASNHTITQTVAASLTVPTIDAVTLTSNAEQVASTPGNPGSLTLTLANVGNVPENVTLTATTPAGVAVGGLNPVTLAVGQSTTETITLTPAVNATLNSTLLTTLTATYGPSGTPQTTSVQVGLLVRSAQTVAIAQAAGAAGQANNSQLAGTLTQLDDVITQLQAAPTDASLLARIKVLLGELNTLLQADPALTSLVTQLAPIQAAANAGNVNGMLALLPAFFTSLTNLLNVEATEQFSVSLSPNQVDLQTGNTKTFAVQLMNFGPDSVTLNLGTAGVPTGMTAMLDQSQVTVAAGATGMANLTLNTQQVSNKVFTLDVTAAATVVTHTVTAIVAVRQATADVLGVTVNPVTVNPGAMVDVMAQVFNTANVTRNILAHIDILDANGNLVMPEQNVPLTLVPGTDSMTLDLGKIDTTPLANGVYSAKVSLLAGDGTPLPGKSAQAFFGVGQPVTASVSPSPSLLPPGTSNVTTTISVGNQGGTSIQAASTIDQPGDQVVWIATSSGNWDQSANWLDTTTNTNHVPSAGDHVTVNVSGITVTVEAGSQSAKTLFVSSASAFVVAGGSLQLGGASEIDGGLTLSSGNLGLGGTLTIAGDASWSGGGIDLDGYMLTNTGTMTLTNTVSLFANNDVYHNLGGTFANKGSIVEQGNGTLNLYDSVVVDNQAAGTYVFAGDGSILHAGGDPTVPTVHNEGTIQKSMGTTSTSSYISVGVYNTGTLEVDNGNLTLGGGGSSSGTTFNVAQNAALTFYSSPFVLSGTFASKNGGLVSFNSCTVGIGAGGVTFNFAPGTLQWLGATFDLNGRALTNTGSVSLASGNNTSIVSNDGVHYGLGGTLVNQGSIVAQGNAGLYLYDNVALDNQAMATYVFAGDGNIFHGVNGDLTAPSVHNEGTIQKSMGTTASSSYINVGVYNTGTLEVDNGNLTLTGGGSSSGTTFNVALNATLTFYNSPFVLSGTFTSKNGGLVSFNSCTVGIGAGGATFNFAPGTLQWLGATFNLKGQTLTNTGSVSLPTNNNISIVSNDGMHYGLGGTLANQGSITAQGNATLYLYDNIVLDNQAPGTYVFAGDGNIYHGSGDLTAPSVHNEGTIQKSMGTTATSSYINVGVYNTGTLEADNGNFTLSGGGSSSGTTFNVAQNAALTFYNSPFVLSGTFTSKNGGLVSFNSCTVGIGAGGATFNFAPGTFQWLGATFNLKGRVLTNAGSVSLPTNNNTSIVSNDGMHYGLGGTLVNQGSVGAEGNASLYLSDNVVLDNQATGTYVFAGDGNIYHGGDLTAPSVHNEGTIQKMGGTGVSTIQLALRNQGTVFSSSGGNSGGLGLTGPVTNTGTIDSNGGSIGLSSAVSNTGTIEAIGTNVSLSGPIDQLMRNQVTGGTWIAKGGATLSFPNGTSINNNAANVTMDGAGSTISGIQSLAVNAGVFVVSHGANFSTSADLTNNGSIIIGPASKLSVTGNYTQGSTGSLDCELGGTPASGNLGVLAVTGASGLGGALLAQAVDGYSPAATDSFKVATWASSSGHFSFFYLPRAGTVAFQAAVSATSTILGAHSATLTSTSVTIASSAPGGATAGQTVTFTATVSSQSGTPTGSVQFQIDGIDVGTPVALAAGKATFSTAALSAGHHAVVGFFASASATLANSDNSTSPLLQVINLAPPTPLGGDNIKWVSTTSGNWDVSANWLDVTTNTNHVPTANDNVTINVSGVTVTVGAGNQAAQTLQVAGGSTLAVAGGNLALSANSEIDGGLTITSGNLQLGGGLTLKGSTLWAGGGVDLEGHSLTNTGMMMLGNAQNASESLYASTSFSSNLGGTLANSGSIVQQGSGGLYLYDSVVLANQSGGSFVFASDGGVFRGDNTFSSITNAGAIQKSGGSNTSTIGVFLANTGTLEVDSGALSMTGGGSSTGTTFKVAQGATLAFTGSPVFALTGTFASQNGGTVEFLNGIVGIGAGGASFNFAAGVLQWNNENINLDGQTLTNAGSLTLVNNNFVYAFDGVSRNLGGTLANSGTIVQQSSGSLYLYDSVVVANQLGGSYVFHGDGSIHRNDGTAPSVTNAGTIQKMGGTGTSVIDVFLANTGTLEVDSGTLSLSGGGSSNGTTFNVAQAATLVFTGSTFALTGAFDSQKGGMVQFANGIVGIGAGGASFNFAAGVLQWNNENVNLDGQTLTNAGSLALVNNNYVYASDGVSRNIGGTLANSGSIVQQGNSALYLYDSDILANQSGGKYVFAGDGGIFRNDSTSPSITNAGTIQKMGGTGNSTISAFVANSGNLEVDSGNLYLSGGGSSSGTVFNVAQGAALVLYNSSFALTGAFSSQNGGTVQLVSGTVGIGAGGATFNFAAGTFQWNGERINLNGQTLRNTGTVAVVSTSTLYANNSVTGNLGGTLANTGTLVQQGASSLNLYDSVVIANQSGGSYVFAGDGGIVLGDFSPSITNAGTFQKSSGTGGSTIGVFLANTGTLEVDSGTLSLNNGGSSTGTTFNVAQGANLVFTGGPNFALTGTFSSQNGGTVQLLNGTVGIGTGGATFNFAAGTFQWNGERINLNEQTLSNAGNVAVVGTSALYANDTTIGNLGGTLANAGTIVQQGGSSLNLYDSVFIANQSGGSFVFAGDGGIFVGDFSPSITNAGMFQKSSGTGTSTINVSLINNGTVEADSGTLALNVLPQASVSALFGSAWVARNGATLSLGNGPNITDNHASVTIDGAGSTVARLQNLSANDGTFTVAHGATFTTVADLANNGTLTIGPKSTLTVTGNYTQVATGTLDFGLGGAPATGSFGVLAVTGSTSLGGVLEAHLVDGYTPAPGDSFTVATNKTNSSGSFAIIRMPSTATLAFHAAVNPMNIVLSAQTAAVTPTAVAVTSSAPNGAAWDQPSNFTATVSAIGSSATPTGSVQFEADGALIGSPITLTGGSAVLTTSQLSVGVHRIAASYLSDSTQFGNSDSSGSPLVQTVSSSPGAALPQLAIEVGYADGLRPGGFFPNPWVGSPNTVFIGDTSTAFDAGAILIVNNSTAAVTVNDVVVTLVTPSGLRPFDLWGSNIIPAGGNLILTQTAGQNFDTSDFPTLTTTTPYPDGETAHAAHLDVSVNGVLLQTLLDTGHILTTGGFDFAVLHNESQNWRLIGTTGITNPGGSVVSVVVTHNLPASGYPIDQTSITPPATTSSSSQVVWDAQVLQSANPSLFQVTGSATNMAPGEVRQISTGTAVAVTTITTNGQPLTTTINLGPVTVAAEHIISLTPATETVERNAQATYTVELKNPLPMAETYTLSEDGLTGVTTNLTSSVMVGAGQTVDVPLKVDVPVGATAGTQVFEVSAHTGAGASDSVEGQLTIAADVALPSLGVNIALAPTQAVAGQGDAARKATDITLAYNVTLTNVGDVTDTYTVSGTFPAGFKATFSSPYGAIDPSHPVITVPAGESNSRNIQLTLIPPVGTMAGTYQFTITAVSKTDGSVKAMVQGSITVLADGVSVTLTPPSGAPGTTFQMTVKNTGTVADTYDLSLGGPAAVVATLASNKVSLSPGQSQMVQITTTAVNFADPGQLLLAARAISEANAAVQASATADLAIASSQGMTAQFNPASQNLPQPGTASFLLLVNNVGNVEDKYTAKIIGTTGPVTANLMGLEGQPTQTIDIFRLPGLSTGAILLQVPITAIGQGTVSVRVTSLSNAAITTTVTATITAGFASTTVLSSDHPKGSVFGERVIFTATVSATTSGASTPTGKVDFKEGATDLTPGGVTLSGGHATFSTSALAVGRHTITASYGGNSSFLPSSGNDAASPQIVTKASSKTTLTSFPLPVFGEQVTFTATVGAVAPGAGTPTGTLTFKEGTRLLAANVGLNSMAKATFSTAPLSVGPHTITAVYSGDGDFLTNTGVFVQPVGKAGTQSSIVSSASTIHLGQTVTFTASVQVLAPGVGMPTGSFKFSDAKVPFGTATMDASGHATFSTSSLAGGSHAISATYLGDANFAASDQSLAIGEFVIRATDTTAMSLSPNPSVYGQPVTFTVTVQATQTGLPFIPSGVVHFNDGSVGAGNVILDATGRGTFSTSGLTAGTHTLTAVYVNGDRNFTPSNSGTHPVVLTVQKGTPLVTLISSRNSSVFGQLVVFTATVTPMSPGGGLATGLVMFKDGSTTLGTAPLDINARRAIFSFATLTVGSHSITATYVGDSNFNAGSSSPAMAESVTKASDTTVVTSSSAPAVFGQPVTFTALIRITPPGAGVPSGLVTFMDGTSVLASGVTVMQGQATFSTSSLAVGNHAILASYAGDGNFLASTSPIYGEIVNKAGTTAAVSSSTNPAVVGHIVTFTATIHVSAPGSGTPTGKVTFKDSTTVLGTATLTGTGVATFTISSLSLGSHTISAMYAGDADFLSSSSTSLIETINSAAQTTALPMR